LQIAVDRRLSAGCPSRGTVLSDPRSRLTALSPWRSRTRFRTGTRHSPYRNGLGTDAALVLRHAHHARRHLVRLAVDRAAHAERPHEDLHWSPIFTHFAAGAEPLTSRQPPAVASRRQRTPKPDAGSDEHAAPTRRHGHFSRTSSHSFDLVARHDAMEHERIGPHELFGAARERNTASAPSRGSAQGPTAAGRRARGTRHSRPMGWVMQGPCRVRRQRIDRTARLSCFPQFGSSDASRVDPSTEAVSRHGLTLREPGIL
jgi:hypothetical protein